MPAHDPKKWDVFTIDLPVQSVTRIGEDGKPFSVTATELYGPHLCIILFADPNGCFCDVIPLTSATDARGGEKWQVWQKTWVRVIHEGKSAAALCEQIRYVCRSRLLEHRGWIGEYDRAKIEEKLRLLLEL